MPRRGNIVKRELPPDTKYNNKVVTRFINALMLEGNKSLAGSTFYRAMDIIQEKTKQDPMQVFKQAISNVKPVVEVKSRRVGGSTYQVPVDVRPDRRVSLAIRWVVNYARQRSEHSMVDKLAMELLDAANQRGASIKKKEDTHKMADANKAFAHYRW